VEFAATHPAPLSDAGVEQLAVGFMDVRLRERGDQVVTPQPISVAGPPVVNVKASPDDRLGEALVELRASVASELLEALKTASPSFFETIVLDLLHRMGYGTSRTDLQRVGGSGDGGIDGVISLDRLGLEKVYVQAKRWQQTVGRPEVQAFYGALAGQRSNKGVFITTSSYTPQAIEFARSVERVVLIDGTRLAQLMIDHEVGVSSRVVRVPKIDSDYFDEE
jgi:restriction system protein